MLMKRKVNFKGKEGVFDTPSFCLFDNDDLQVEFGLPQPIDCVYVLVVNHGANELKIILHSLCVTLSAEWLKKGGNEPIWFTLEKRDKTALCVYSKYDIEPLYIERFESDYTAYYGAIQKAEAKASSVQDELNAVRHEIAVLRETVLAMPALIEKAKREAVIEATGGDPMSA